MKSIAVLLIGLFLISCNSKNKELPMNQKIDIAHSTASGYLQEPTLEAKAMEHNINPDFI
jgi:hypothetical protein|tara:strand:+ start:1175 stop:1354 length:180 start_codon:yes stop_codon:yes gene_type:complete